MHTEEPAMGQCRMCMPGGAEPWHLCALAIWVHPLLLAPPARARASDPRSFSSSTHLVDPHNAYVHEQGGDDGLQERCERWRAKVPWALQAGGRAAPGGLMGGGRLCRAAVAMHTDRSNRAANSTQAWGGSSVALPLSRSKALASIPGPSLAGPWSLAALEGTPGRLPVTAHIPPSPAPAVRWSRCSQKCPALCAAG